MLKTASSSGEDACDAETDDANVMLFDNISTPSLTVGETAAKTGARRNVVDISLAHLRTELRNVFAGLKNRQTLKGSVSLLLIVLMYFYLKLSISGYVIFTFSHRLESFFGFCEVIRGHFHCSLSLVCYYCQLLASMWAVLPPVASLVGR